MTDRELAHRMLETADALAVIRREITRRDKTGHHVIHGRPEAQSIRQQAGGWIGALLSSAARLALAAPQS
jgi:hypothetical protein